MRDNKIMDKGEILTLLLLTPKCSQSDIAKKTDITYSFQVEIIKRLRKRGLLKTKKQDRRQIITLTQKGETIQLHLIKAFVE